MPRHRPPATEARLRAMARQITNRPTAPDDAGPWDYGPARLLDVARRALRPGDFAWLHSILWGMRS